MSLVLAGFLGAPGKHFPESPKDYRIGLYKFEEEEPRISKFFSESLCRYLVDKDRKPERWIIMGTHKSIWDALYEMIEPGQHTNEFKTQLDDLSKALRTDRANGETAVTQEMLDQWGETISEKLGLGIEVICVLTGNATGEEEQQRIWHALLDYVHKGDEVVFDITHGFRHFPVIATFSLMLLRQLRGVQKVDFYYGAFDMAETDGPEKGIAPVVRVPICQQLSDAAQAVATHDFTGDYRALGGCLQMDGAFDEQLDKVAYADELNRPKKEKADDLLKQLQSKGGFLATALKPELQESLSWVAHSRLDQQYHRKAQSALDCGQYFKALAYLYEALLLAQMVAVKARRPDIQWLDHRLRNRAKQELELEQTYLTRRLVLNEEDAKVVRNTFVQIAFLRNSVLHGTETRNTGNEKDNAIRINQAINGDEPLLREILNNGFDLYDLIAPT